MSAPGSRLTITTSPEAISVAKVAQRNPDLPNTEVYRFDGSDTTVDRTAFVYRRTSAAAQ